MNTIMLLGIALLLATACSSTKGAGSSGSKAPSGSAYLGKNGAGQEVLTRACLRGQLGTDCVANAARQDHDQPGRRGVLGVRGAGEEQALLGALRDPALSRRAHRPDSV